MINTSIKPIKPIYYRERFGTYGYIYFKHAQKQRISYGIYLRPFREIMNIPKECVGKSKKYLL